MKFYAAYHTHGTEFCNDIDYIVRFDTRAARDAYVDRDKFDGSWRREAITRDEARRIFPQAFRLLDARDANDGVMDARDWRSDVEGEEFFAPYALDWDTYGTPSI